jgi:glycosyltransferase involved in cell wall biosynthesis
MRSLIPEKTKLETDPGLPEDGQAAYPVRIGIQQRVLPAYRVPFFDLLARSCQNGLAVFAGRPLPGEALGATGVLCAAKFYEARNLHMGTGRLYACHQRNFIAWLEEWRPDVLIVEANPRYLSTPGAVRWMHQRGKPVIGWGLGAPPLRGFWRRMLRDRFLTSFDALLTYSGIGAEQYRKVGFPPEDIFIAPNAMAPRPTNPSPVRATGFSGGKATVLFVGRLQARKRVDLLLQACAALPEALQPRLVIVGEGSVRPELEDLARQIYPLAQFTGARHGEELEPYWAAADLFVLPGTGGLAVQQAMAAGLPVMAAEADGTQVDLVRKENGWLLKPGDVQYLTDRLAEALADPARLRSMGEASYRLVAEEVNLEKMVAVFMDAVHKVLE